MQDEEEPTDPLRRPLATAEQVAAYLGIPKQTVYTWRAAGEGPPAVKIGRKHLRFLWADVDAWVESKRVD